MEKLKSAKHYIFASDFDQTLSYNDTGYVLSELLGIPTKEFERKAEGMARLNLVNREANSRTCCCTIRNFTTGFVPSICAKSENAFV
jgi:hypothetical protein